MKVQKVRDRYIDNPQNVASDPGFSVYVSAAAGSGKTKVLTDRFLRLLLKGVPASKILCLTFTNAAANEMLGRITEQLCHWAILTDSELSQILNQLTGNDYQPDLLEKARSLYDEFFYNIDAIKIQTLHSFCSHILSKSSKLNFNSPGKLDIVSDSDYEKYVRASTDEALKLMFQKNKVHAENITTLYELNTIYQYAKEILQNHKGKIINYLQGDFQDVCLGMYEDFGALYNCEVEELIQVFIEKTDSNHLIRIANILSKENESIGDEILSWLNASDKKENLLQYKKIFLTEKNVPTIKLKVSKEFQKNYQEIIISLIDEQYRIAELFHKISAQNAAKYTESFLVFAKLVISYFELMKVEHGVLEYEDLLIRALHLLRSEEGVNDLLYNIDIAIDHVLIDEAQDLSEIQWELVKIITSEFFKDEELSNHLSNRTIFIVGDI